MKRIVLIVFVLSALLLAGCGATLDGSYHNASGNEAPEGQGAEKIVSVSRYAQLHDTLADMVHQGKERGIISVQQYDQTKVVGDTNEVIRDVMIRDPFGAYAVEDIQYEVGTNGGQPAIAVTIKYRYSRAVLQKIRKVNNQEQMTKAIAGAVDRCEAGIVLYVERYEELDFDQWLSSYAALHPDVVMEVPKVWAAVYPEEGRSRVVELKFHYENSRDVLKAMQSYVQRLFGLALEQATEGDQQQRFAALYKVLRDPNEPLKLETSITPAYSFLVHRVGDARTAARVYSALCTQAGLECMTVTGTKGGAPWYWNIVCVDGIYHHVDLLEGPAGVPQFLADGDMENYVWDYTAYPVCEAMPEPKSTEVPADPQPTE